MSGSEGSRVAAVLVVGQLDLVGHQSCYNCFYFGSNTPRQPTMSTFNSEGERLYEVGESRHDSCRPIHAFRHSPTEVLVKARRVADIGTGSNARKQKKGKRKVQWASFKFHRWFYPANKVIFIGILY